jgi:hypothetical protein
LREQQFVLARVDDARKPNTAFMAFEAVAFKSARVDAGATGPAEYYLRATRRTRDELRIQYRFLSPPAHETTSQESCANLACPAVLKD